MNHQRYLVFHYPETQEEEMFPWDSPDVPRQGEYVNFRDGDSAKYKLCIWTVIHDAVEKNGRTLTYTLIYGKIVE